MIQKLPEKEYQMSQLSMSERLKFLMSSLDLKIGPFARTMGVSNTNIRNYLERGSKPSSEFLENLVTNFETINPTWLLTGQGEPFLSANPNSTLPTANAKNFSDNVFGNNNRNNRSLNKGDNNTNALADYQKDIAVLQKENELLREQLADKERTIQILLKQTS